MPEKILGIGNTEMAEALISKLTGGKGKIMEKTDENGTTRTYITPDGKHVIELQARVVKQPDYVIIFPDAIKKEVENDWWKILPHEDPGWM